RDSRDANRFGTCIFDGHGQRVIRPGLRRKLEIKTPTRRPLWLRLCGAAILSLDRDGKTEYTRDAYAVVPARSWSRLLLHDRIRKIVFAVGTWGKMSGEN